MNNRRSFSTEFKHEAACLVLDQDYSVRRWVDQLADERRGKTPAKSRAMTPDQQRIQELEARIRKIEREKEILKKATALLMSDSFNR